MSRGTRDTPRALTGFAYGAITLFGRPFQTVPLPLRIPRWSPTTPAGIASRRFRLFPLRSPLLRESLLISLPPGTEMFQFPGFASATYGFSDGWPGMTPAGFPHSEIPGSVLARQLPEAYRSLPRPSSPPGAKASTVCPYLLDQNRDPVRCLHRTG